MVVRHSGRMLYKCCGYPLIQELEWVEIVEFSQGDKKV